MFDVVITGGTIVDGTGKPGFTGDLGIKGDTITALEPQLDPSTAQVVIRAQGWTVAPGFIDIHSHTDHTLELNPWAMSKVMQGVTTEVVGQCGLTKAPVFDQHRADLFDYLANTISLSEEDKKKFVWPTMHDYLCDVTSHGSSVNIAYLVGQGTIRVGVMGFKQGEPSPEELRTMAEAVERELRNGAWGMSSGLQYPPNSLSGHEELVALSRIVQRYGGIWAVHQRSEGADIFKSLAELLAVAEESGVKLQISHLKVEGRPNWGNARHVLECIADARARGLQVNSDQYPYTAAGSGLIDVIPPWAGNLGPRAVSRLLADDQVRARMRREIGEGLPSWPSPFTHGVGWDAMLIASVQSDKNQHLVGRTIAEIARETRSDAFDIVFDLLQQEEGNVKLTYFSMCESDLEEIMRDPNVFVASDGRAVGDFPPFSQVNPHPRYYGAFPRVLGHYVRERRILSLEEAIRKMTSAPASYIGLRDRGCLKCGNKADVVVFDDAEIEDTATFRAPHQYPRGIHWVLVNGQSVVREQQHLKTLPGRILRRDASD